MTTVISGSSPSITFSDATTQTTAFTSTPSVTSITTSADATINGLTVGKGGTANVTNTAFGINALAGPNTNANQSLTAIGQSALAASTGSFYSVAIGTQSMFKTTATSYSTAVGAYSLYNQTTGTNNTAIGNSALYGVTTAQDNVGVGNSVLNASTTGSYNVCVGNLALVSNTTGANNTAVGYQAGYTQTTATTNTFIGTQAGYYVTTGNSNVMIGSNAGALSVNATTGDGNVYIGGGVRGSAAGNTQEIVIGYLTTGKGSSTGFINPNSGGVYQGNNSSSWSTTSDQRLKKNIVDNTVGLSAINGIQVRNFEYRLPEEVTELPQNQAINIAGVQLGAIAQELQQILPDCVKTESTGVLAVNPDNIMWHMINAIKELNAKVIALETKLGV